MGRPPLVLGKTPQESAAALKTFKDLAGWPVGCDEVIVEIAESASDENFPGAILPRFDNGKVVYYGIAPTARSWRELRPLLNAFSGPTVTDFSGMSSELRAEDAVEGFLLSLGPHAVARLVPSEATARIASFSLRRMRLLIAESESRERNRPDSTSQILNSFRIALSIPDPDAARLYLQRLRTEFRIDALNVRFLEIQLSAALGEWEEILRKGYFNSLCLTRRSRAVSLALVQALYRVHIAPCEQDMDSSALLNVFKRSVKPVCGDLFEYLLENLPLEQLKMFTLEALAAASLRHDRLMRFKWLADSGQIPQFADFWAKMGGSFQDEIVSHDSPETRFQMLVRSGVAPSVTSGRAALIYAFETGSVEISKEAVGLIGKMTENDTLEMLTEPAIRRLWRYLLEETGGSMAPANWFEWFDRLPDPSFTEAVRVAERASSEWPSESVLDDPAQSDLLAKAITSLPQGLAADRFARALSLFILWLREDSAFPNRSAIPVYENLIDFLALYPARSNEDLFTLSWLFDGVLSLGTDRDRYGRILDSVGVMAGEAGALRTLDWMLDLMELSIVHPSPETEVRDRFLYLLIGKLTPLVARMTRLQIETLAAILQMLGWEVSALGALSTVFDAPSPAPDVVLSKLSGTKVGFYSLTESVGKNVASVLKKIVPSAEFRWNGDVVGTDKLKALSRDADLLIIMTQSAKHAATDFIQMHRRGKPILYPRGRGSSSVLRDLTDFCAKLA